MKRVGSGDEVLGVFVQLFILLFALSLLEAGVTSVKWGYFCVAVSLVEVF